MTVLSGCIVRSVPLISTSCTVAVRRNTEAERNSSLYAFVFLFSASLLPIISTEHNDLENAQL